MNKSTVRRKSRRLIRKVSREMHRAGYHEQGSLYSDIARSLRKAGRDLFPRISRPSKTPPQ